MAQVGKFQTLLEYSLARSILGLLGILPLSWSMALGRRFGRVGHSMLGNLRRTGERNLSLAFPEKTEPERARLLKLCFENLGRQLGLFAHFSSASRETLLDITESEGLEHLEAAQAKGKGVILFTGHVGAWELSSFGLSLRDKPLSFLVRRIDNPRVEQVVDRTRTRFGNRSVDKRAAARSMLKILHSGETLGLLVDLNTLETEGIFVDFFGLPASTTFMIAKLALRTEASVIPIFVPWNDQRGKYRIHMLPPVCVKRTDDEARDVHNLTAELTKILEEYIRRYPDQWLWIHKRWKTRPSGEPDLYN